MEKKRKSISNKLRFEVFKRDSFKCQYCGVSAPDVLLQVDHIKPVKDGGSNNITNLITSCATCNSGKGARLLSDKSVVQKQHKQLKEINERREQLKMMMEWREELLQLENEKINHIKDRFEEIANCLITDYGVRSLSKIVNKFPINIVLDAVEISTSQYLVGNEKGGFTSESIDKAFNYIGGICTIKMREKDNPDLAELYYIRGILRKRLHYCNDCEALNLLKQAYQYGVFVDELKEIALSVRNWTQFKNQMEELTGYDD